MLTFGPSSLDDTWAKRKKNTSAKEADTIVVEIPHLRQVAMLVSNSV